MREKPYQVVDIFTGETVAWCSYEESIEYMGKPGFDISYRPGRKKKVKK